MHSRRRRYESAIRPATRSQEIPRPPRLTTIFICSSRLRAFWTQTPSINFAESTPSTPWHSGSRFTGGRTTNGVERPLWDREPPRARLNRADVVPSREKAYHADKNSGTYSALTPWKPERTSECRTVIPQGHHGSGCRRYDPSVGHAEHGVGRAWRWE